MPSSLCSSQALKQDPIVLGPTQHTHTPRFPTCFLRVSKHQFLLGRFVSVRTHVPSCTASTIIRSVFDPARFVRTTRGRSIPSFFHACVSAVVQLTTLPTPGFPVHQGHTCNIQNSCTDGTVRLGVARGEFCLKPNHCNVKVCSLFVVGLALRVSFSKTASWSQIHISCGFMCNIVIPTLKRRSPCLFRPTSWF